MSKRNNKTSHVLNLLTNRTGAGENELEEAVAAEPSQPAEEPPVRQSAQVPMQSLVEPALVATQMDFPEQEIVDEPIPDITENIRNNLEKEDMSFFMSELQAERMEEQNAGIEPSAVETSPYTQTAPVTLFEQTAEIPQREEEGFFMSEFQPEEFSEGEAFESQTIGEADTMFEVDNTFAVEMNDQEEQMFEAAPAAEVEYEVDPLLAPDEADFVEESFESVAVEFEPEPEPVAPVPAPASPAPAFSPAPSPAPQRTGGYQDPMDNYNYNYTNILEEIVKNKVLQIMDSFGVCKCNKCVNDVIAYALNLLPAKYVVTHKTGLYIKAVAYEKQHSADITSAISQACIVIGESPRH